METNPENPVGRARWRVIRPQWSRTLDEVILVLANRPSQSAPTIHRLRLTLRANAGARLNSDNVGIRPQQTDDDLEAGLDEQVLSRSPGGLWRLSAGWENDQDLTTMQAIRGFDACLTTRGAP